MGYYELFYIIPSKYTEAEVQDVMKKVAAAVAKHEGQIKRHEDGGKLKLAYPLKRVTFGNYILMELEMVTDKIKSLRDEIQLGLTQEVLRFSLQSLPAALRGRPLKLTSYTIPLSEPEAESPKVAAPIQEARKVSTEIVSDELLDKKIDAALAEDAAKL